MRRLAQLRERFDQFQAVNLDIVIVLCQKRENVASWLDAHPTPFPILVDDDRSCAKRWGVYVTFSYDSFKIARPASFVVDPTGAVRYAHLSRHQMDHAPIDEILASAT